MFVIAGIVMALIAWLILKDEACAGFFVLFGCVMQSLPKKYLIFSGGRANRETSEPGYFITRKRDGYPLVVGKSALIKALQTGDYIYDGPGDRDVPVGQQYRDERLN